jgi:hypothetical protein
MAVVDNLPIHSPLGASGAYRWMVCPGSVQQSQGIQDEESEYAAEGTAAHSLAERCITANIEPWTTIGSEVGDFTVSKEMADCVASYMEALGSWHPNRDQGNSWVERRFHCPEIHQFFYGTSDFVYLDTATRTLHVWDYKHGAGIVVEAENNPQGMYYAAGVLEDLNAWNDVDFIVIHIFQPRGWHYEGPHRTWEVSTDELEEWLWNICVPAMDHALVSNETKTGDHCRFCPARQAQCPAMMEDISEFQELLMLADTKGADKLTPEQLGRLLELNEIAKIAIKAAQKTAYGMLSAGAKVPGIKLVASRTNREFKEGADKAAIKEFGKKQAYTEPSLKSPAQIDALPGGKDFTARWAFKPEGGMTVAVESDPRKPVKRDVRSLFKPVESD